MEFLRIGVTSDHNGLALKEKVLAKLSTLGLKAKDYGPFDKDPVDYPDFAKALALGIKSGDIDGGIAICGTGLGMAIACNKISGVRAAPCSNLEFARLARAHNNANVLCLSGQEIDFGLELLEIFLKTPFDGGRHQRRIEKIKALESL